MRHVLLAIAIAASSAVSPVSAHHSYAAYDTTRVVEVEGIVQDFEWISPHSLIKVRATDNRLYTVEWRATAALQRVGIGRDALKKGDQVIVTGSPRRDIDQSGVMNFKSVRRLSDGWTWPTT